MKGSAKMMVALLAIAFLVGTYLVYALVHPEKF
ncbi:MAG: potassium-transporting ATPase subunit F [Candidatus Spyradenecus sp.]